MYNTWFFQNQPKQLLPNGINQLPHAQNNII